MYACLWGAVLLSLTSVVNEYSWRAEGSASLSRNAGDATRVRVSKPPAPASITLTPMTYNRVRVQWNTTGDQGANDEFIAYVVGDAGRLFCRTKNGSMCDIYKIVPQVLHTVCVRNFRPVISMAKAASSSNGDAQLLSNGVLEVANVFNANSRTCSDAVCDNITIPLEATTIYNLTIVNQTAVAVSCTTPPGYDWMDVIFAYIEGWDEKHCKMNPEDVCIINGLSKDIPYKVCAQHCYDGSDTRSAAASSIKGLSSASTNEPLKFVFVRRRFANVCSVADCRYITIHSEVADNLLLKILLGIFIPLLIILLVLLFVFRKRIPLFRRLYSKELPVDFDDQFTFSTSAN